MTKTDEARNNIDVMTEVISRLGACFLSRGVNISRSAWVGSWVLFEETEFSPQHIRYKIVVALVC